MGTRGIPGFRLTPILVIVVAALVQVSVVQRIASFSDRADLVVLAVVSVALLEGSVAGATYGLLGGLVVELAAGMPLGPHALVATIVGYAAGRWGEILVTDEHPAPPLIAGALGALAMQVGRPLVEFLIIPGVQPDGPFSVDDVLGIAFNTLLAVPVYLLVRRVIRRSALPVDQPLGDA